MKLINRIKVLLVEKQKTGKCLSEQLERDNTEIVKVKERVEEYAEK